MDEATLMTFFFGTPTYCLFGVPFLFFAFVSQQTDYEYIFLAQINSSLQLIKKEHHLREPLPICTVHSQIYKALQEIYQTAMSASCKFPMNQIRDITENMCERVAQIA